jgi:hypothetical protein
MDSPCKSCGRDHCIKVRGYTVSELKSCSELERRVRAKRRAEWDAASATPQKTPHTCIADNGKRLTAVRSS